VRDVAREFKLDWHAVKTLDKQSMAEQIKCAGMPGPKVIGIDEISIRKGRAYRIVVSDPESFTVLHASIGLQEDGPSFRTNPALSKSTFISCPTTSSNRYDTGQVTDVPRAAARITSRSPPVSRSGRSP
jgi:hypothetical protein